jgi:hypothetical protein
MFFSRANTSQQQSESMLAQYNAAEAIDTLHECVLQAKERQSEGEAPKDAWRVDLAPRGAVRARTAPVLEKEKDRMKVQLEEVFPYYFYKFARS